tara:strand:- start:706 stop:948 length:243 start_codon:yes stop_codon:yes gene_type:complete
MSRYTDQQVLAFGSTPQARVLSVKVNGGSLLVERYDGVDWVEADSITADKVSPYFTQNSRLRFTPAGGAVFDIDETERSN